MSSASTTRATASRRRSPTPANREISGTRVCAGDVGSLLRAHRADAVVYSPGQRGESTRGGQGLRGQTGSGRAFTVELLEWNGGSDANAESELLRRARRRHGRRRQRGREIESRRGRIVRCGCARARRKAARCRPRRGCGCRGRGDDWGGAQAAEGRDHPGQEVVQERRDGAGAHRDRGGADVGLV